MALTDTALRNAKPAAKPRKLFDERGLFLLVTPAGGKWWRLKYRFRGKEKLLSLGTYPDVTLAKARERRDEARRLLADGIDPSVHRRAVRAQVEEQAANTFQAVALEWHSKHAPTWSTAHANRIKRRLEVDVFPWLGARPIAEVEPPELLTVIRRIERRGALETAHRALRDCGMVFRYAVATNRASRDPAADLRGALPPVKTRHFATLTEPKAVGDLLRAIDDYQGEFVTRCALQLAPLVFVRPGELRRAEWTEIDLVAAEWRIPAAKMKMREAHIVPLARQALAILRELQPLTGRSRYVFPSIRSRERPMSENTINAALRRLGYPKEAMTGHGVRAMASTLLHGLGWPSEVIERQLAHGDRNKVRATYNHAQHLPERCRMMQAWGDYLDSLKEGEKGHSLGGASPGSVERRLSERDRPY